MLLLLYNFLFDVHATKQIFYLTMSHYRQLPKEYRCALSV